VRKLDVVIDAGPLIYLSLLGRLNLLPDLFGRLWVVEAVYQEVVIQGKGQPGAGDTESAVASGWLQRVAVRHRAVVEALLADLDLGEAETIAVARELNADGVLMDDRTGRARAHSMGLQTSGTIGVLLLAREAGKAVDVKRDLDKLMQHNFRVSSELYNSLMAGL
jgi:predicted nucleic acid-binding protein